MFSAGKRQSLLHSKGMSSTGGVRGVLFPFSDRRFTQHHIEMMDPAGDPSRCTTVAFGLTPQIDMEPQTKQRRGRSCLESGPPSGFHVNLWGSTSPSQSPRFCQSKGFTFQIWHLTFNQKFEVETFTCETWSSIVVLTVADLFFWTSRSGATPGFAL